jgi:glycosyltransferase involved in cell wall biosynthesis
MSTRTLDEITFTSLTMWRSFARCREFTRGRKIDVMIATNYSMGMAAWFMRCFGKTRKVVVLLSDFLPARGSLPVRIHRRITTALTRFVCRRADEVWTVSPRIPTASVNPRNFLMPICIDDNRVPAGERNEIGYIGFPSPDHALPVLFDICRKHGFRLNIIGDSPYLQSIRPAAPPDTVFHGMLSDSARINEIFSRCFCGYAVYLNTGPNSYSYFGIPSKTFACFASNTPVVTTRTAHFTENIEKFGVGRVVEPVPEEIEKAVLQLKEQFPTFYEAINRFREKWNADAEQFHRDHLPALWEK